MNFWIILLSFFAAVCARPGGYGRPDSYGVGGSYGSPYGGSVGGYNGGFQQGDGFPGDFNQGGFNEGLGDQWGR